MFLSVRKILINLVKDYGINFNSDYYEELKTEADMLIFDFIDRTSSRYIGQIISYMNAYIKGNLKGKIIHDLFEQNQDFLNKVIYKINNKEEINTTYFSDDMLKLIESLDNIEQRYIILSFKELYEDEEIANLWNISLEQVLEIRAKTLEKLRQNENIKLLSNKSLARGE